MPRLLILLISIAVFFIGALTTKPLEAKIIHKERSLYRNIMVTQEFSERCLLFTVKRRSQSRQSCKDLKDPDRLVFRYAQVTMSSFALQENPKTILILGLGGGTLPMTYAKLLPDADITSVEIDSSVTNVAKEFFGMKLSEKNKVVEKDARVFVKRAKRKNQKYDLIVLDAFNGDYIPEHLMTREFLEEVKELLSEDGVVVANTFSTSDLYDHESVTYQKVFKEFYNFKMPMGNRVIIASAQKLPSYKTLINNAHNLKLPLHKFGVSLLDNISLIKTAPDWNRNARVLTDQFAPANLLQGRD
jgi:spermidine synthase